jgi:hypothetical protein
MKPLNLTDVVQYVETHIGAFHDRRLSSLKTLKLERILKRKNPYLFRAKDLTPEALIRGLLEAHLSSQEETIFGEFLEGLAIFVCERTLDGRKSATSGIDLEFVMDGTLYLTAIKSGPNWGNSSQIDKMRADFRKAMRIHRTNNPASRVAAINGCCYGQEDHPDKDDYQKLCGQRFWSFISGDDDLYIRIIEPLGHRARERNETFLSSYTDLVVRFVEEFMRDFCVGYRIDWERLVKYNSAAHN